MDRFIAGDTKPRPFDSAVSLGVSSLPNLHRVPTDRNRTSTFAFTGNKFEYRALGASQSPSRANQVLNAIVADSIRHMADDIERLTKKGKGKSTQDALREVTANTLKQHKRIVFNGNGYSDEWQAEAARRGLPNFRSTPKALDTYYSEENIALFESLKVLDRTELQARQIILMEDYSKRLCIEVRVLCQLCVQSIAPVVVRYIKEVHDALSVTSTLPSANTTPTSELLKALTTHLNAMLGGVDELKSALHDVHSQENVSASAHYCEDQLIPRMGAVRTAADALEQIVPADQWPLPTYHQMLFHQD